MFAKQKHSIWVFEKNEQLQLFGSKCFNRISKLQVLHSIWKTGNRFKVFLQKTYSEKIHARQYNMKIVQHEESLKWK